ncbi:MAG: type II toxin-antitoxin system RelE/ParE family toxin [Rhizobiaceae bacterium]
MRDVVWSDDALDDFESSIAYIARDSARGAHSVADKIESAIQRLTDMPTGHQGRVKGTYEKLVQGTPYIVAYAMSDRRITILRIIHAMRDWPDDTWPKT